MTGGGVRSPLPWLGALLLVYLGVPVLAFCARLVATPERGFHDPGLFPALIVSVVAASITTAIATLCGVPLARLLARARGRLGAILLAVVLLPLAVPPVMGGVLLVYLVGPYTWLGRLFGGHLTDSLAGVVLAQLFVASPFLVVAARSSFAALDPSIDDVAATLGHGPLHRFLRVDVPIAAPAIQAGMVLTWLRAFGEYGATVVLAYHPMALPVYTFTEFSATGLPGTMAPTALALGVAAAAVVVSRLVLVRRRPLRARAAEPSGAAPRQPVERPASPVSFELHQRLGPFQLAVAHRSDAVRLAVLGPSGSGKSTLLRCLAGLYGAAPGPVAYGDRRVDALRVEDRRVGYVAQGFGLFPHLTTWENVRFGVGADAAAAAHWLARLQLSGLEDRLPSQLSGGQRQRVALAQALARSPDVLLLDEPFSALDTPVRHELRRELRRLQHETGVATVLVTHDAEEAAYLADEVLVVSGGRALQAGPVGTVYRHPVSPEAARLVGVSNVSEGTVAGPGTFAAGGTVLAADTGGLAAGTPVLWSVRPEQVRVAIVEATRAPGPVGGPTGPGSTGRASPGLVGVIADVADVGWAADVLVEAAGGLELTARVLGDPVPAVGQPCVVELPAGSVSVWAAEGEVPPTAGAPGVGPATATVAPCPSTASAVPPGSSG